MAATDTDPDLLTVQETASLLRISVKTVYRYILSGRLLGAVKLAREYRIPRASIDELLNDGAD